MSELPTSVEPQTFNAEAELTVIVAGINDVRSKIDAVSQEIAKASLLISEQPGPNYAAIEALLNEIRSAWLPEALARNDKLAAEFATLQTQLQLAGQRQLAAEANLAEVRALHDQLNRLFVELQLKAEASVGVSSLALQQATGQQVLFDRYFGQLGALKHLYFSILNLHPVAPPTPVSNDRVSRYNNDYWCEVLDAYRGDDFVKLAFHVHGNMSLGPLQSPLDSKVFAFGKVAGVTEHSIELESETEIKGTLVLRFDESIPASESVLFSYGSAGYSQVLVA